MRHHLTKPTLFLANPHEFVGSLSIRLEAQGETISTAQNGELAGCSSESRDVDSAALLKLVIQ